MIFAPNQLDRAEVREGLAFCELRVSAVCFGSVSPAERDQRADVLSRTLFEAALSRPVRLRYRVESSSRIDMRVSIGGDSLSDWSLLESTLASERGFAFERVSGGEEDDCRTTTAIALPSLLLDARMPRTLGYGGEHAAASRAVRLSVMPPLSPGCLDDILTVAATAGAESIVEIGLRPRNLDKLERESLESFLEAGRPGTSRHRVFSEWRLMSEEARDSVESVVRTWLKSGKGVAVSVRAHGLRASAAATIERLVFGIGTDGHLEARDLSSAPGRTDLAACVPLGGHSSRIVPTDPELLKAIGPLRAAPDLRRLPSSGSQIGTVAVGTSVASVRILPRDRDRNVYCVGSTGVGKSTMLTSLIIGDIEAGDGVCVIDPHGDLTQQVLDRMPSARTRDVRWLRPGQGERTVGLNLLERDQHSVGGSPALLAGELIRIVGRLYDLTIAGGPMFEQYMRGAALLVMENRQPGGTLLDVVRLFEDDSFRDSLLKTCTSAVVAEFWTKTAHRASREAALSNIAPYIVSKLNAFVSNAAVRAVVGQRRSTIDFRTAMDSRAIVLLDLSVGSLGIPDAQLLGLIALSRLFAAALGRVADRGGSAPPMRVYVDEAQLFATDSLAEAMAQSRKGGLSFTLANQNLAQLRSTKDGTRLQESILGNASTFLAFRVGPYDAEALAPLFGPTLTRSDLERLPDRHVACRMLVEGVPLDPFVCRTLAPTPLTAASARTRAEIEEHALTYTVPVADVESAIASERVRGEPVAHHVEAV